MTKIYAIGRRTGLMIALALALASNAFAQDKAKAVSPEEAGYMGSGSSRIGETEMHQNINPKAPAMTMAEFDNAKKIYFERCAGCNGVLRKGATGKPLTTDKTLAGGTEYLKVFIKYGSAGGMPNWGTSGDLTDAEVDMMARYVTHCYHRPRQLPAWPYNLFAMAHDCSREEVLGKVAHIATLLGVDCRAYDVLFSMQILKKSGLRIGL